MYELIEENAHFIVVHKFPGVGFHDEREGAVLRPGLASALKEQFGALYPVHRLDKVTSGLLSFAKDLNTCQQLNVLFATHQIEKYYLAIADKKPRKKQGRICGDMLKARRGAWKLARTTENPRLTEFVSTSLGQSLCLFLLRPYTGKTHQLRVAMKSLGAAIIALIYTLSVYASPLIIIPLSLCPYLGMAFFIKIRLVRTLYQKNSRRPGSLTGRASIRACHDKASSVMLHCFVGRNTQSQTLNKRELL